ncbi:hypothetical protein [Miltoncostaea oceani]|nr:hypothetical protein [Miltoncostaea oceani]
MTTITTWSAAVTPSPTSDHSKAQSPRSDEAIAGSTVPWRCPCGP